PAAGERGRAPHARRRPGGATHRAPRDPDSALVLGGAGAAQASVGRPLIISRIRSAVLGLTTRGTRWTTNPMAARYSTVIAKPMSQTRMPNRILRLSHASTESTAQQITM